MGVNGVKYDTTKLPAELKARLKQRAGSHGIGEYIEMMLTFFDVTGAKPSDFQTHPTIQLKKEVERCITVTRAGEVSITKKLDEVMRLLVSSGSQASNREQQPPVDQEVTDEMIQRVVSENERLNKQLKEKERQLGQLQTQLNQVQHDPQTGIELNKEALELFQWLQTAVKKNTFDDDYKVGAAAWRGFVERFNKLKN